MTKEIELENKIKALELKLRLNNINKDPVIGVNDTYCMHCGCNMVLYYSYEILNTNMFEFSGCPRCNHSFVD